MSNEETYVLHDSPLVEKILDVYKHKKENQVFWKIVPSPFYSFSP